MPDLRIEQLIEKSLDGALNDEERAELDEHIAHDPTLNSRIAGDAMLQNLLRASGKMEFASGFKDRVMGDIETEAALSGGLERAKATSFKPFFEVRVMRRIKEEAAQSGALLSFEVTDLLSRLFPRITVPALAAASIAMVANVSAASSGAPIVDAVFGLPSEEPTELAMLIWD